MQYLLLVAGFVLLIKGADFFVDGSSGLAKRLKVPSMIIGLTVVAMGTSLPETAVSVSASIQGKNDLAISNAVGSNIFNLMIVCGITAVITPLLIKKSTLKREFPFSIVCAALLMIFGLTGQEVSRIEGIILLALFGTEFFELFLVCSGKSRQKQLVFVISVLFDVVAADCFCKKVF